jgi:hypothetical protein
MNPDSRNLFMKVLTRPRGPDNLGRVSFEQIFALIGSGFPSLPKLANFNF